MASLQTHRDREDTDGTKYIGAIGGLDITVDGCPPEFDIVKLRWEIDQGVLAHLNLPLDDLILSSSSIAIVINPSRKLSSIKEHKTVAVIISVNIHDHKDGGISFTMLPHLGSSMAEGVKNYVVKMKDTILTQFNGASITEIKIVTNITKDDDSDEYLTFKIDPVTGTAKPQYAPWQEAAASTDWRRRMKHVCGICHVDIISGQSRVICGNCSSEFHWTCVDISAMAGSKAGVSQWLCSSCNSSAMELQNGQHHTGTAKRKRKRAKRH